MKKLIFLVILGALIYSAYLYFVKHQNPLTAFEKKGTATETVTTKTSETKNHLIFNLEIGKYVTVKSAIIPAGEIRLLGVDEANQSCMVSIYKSPGTVSKGMDLRKIVKNKWTLEVRLISVKGSSAILSIAPITNPDDALTIINPSETNSGKSTGTAADGKEYIINLKSGKQVSIKCRNLSYGYIGLNTINHSRDECTITVYEIKGTLSKNVDFRKQIGTVTVKVRIVSLQQSGVTLALSLSDYSDRFEAGK